jgi:hypothetical protein
MKYRGRKYNKLLTAIAILVANPDYQYIFSETGKAERAFLLSQYKNVHYDVQFKNNDQMEFDNLNYSYAEWKEFLRNTVSCAIFVPIHDNHEWADEIAASVLSTLYLSPSPKKTNSKSKSKKQSDV